MRRLITLMAAAVLVFGALAVGPTVPTAAAASIGDCTSGGGSIYRSGEKNVASYGLRGVYAEAYLGGPAGPCSPNDNSGINVGAVQISLARGEAGAVAMVTLGIMQCNHTDNSAWPSYMCDGQNRVYAEQHGTMPWDYNMWNLGTATSGTIYDLQISYGCSGHASEYCWFVNGSLKKTFDMGLGLKPSNTDQTAAWQGETHDKGDGLGRNVSGKSSGLGRIQYQKNSDKLWYLRSVNGSCDVVSGQHHCVANGSYGLYLYTVN